MGTTKIVAMAYLTAAILALTACGAEEEEESEANQITAPFLTASLFSPGSDLEELTGSEVVVELEEESFLYDNQPEDTSEDETDACVDGKFTAIGFSAKGDTLSFGIATDFGECFKEEGVTIDSVPVQAYFEFTCAGADLSQFDGLTMEDELDNLGDDIECDGGSFLSNMEMGIKGSVKGNNGSADIDMKMYMYEGASPTTHCKTTIEGDVETITSCQSESYTNNEVSGSVSSTTETYTKFVANSLKSDPDSEDPWFDEGSVSATVNEWIGTVTYSGSTSGPSYSMSGGGDSIDGNLIASSLRFQGGTARAAGLRDRLVSSLRQQISRGASLSAPGAR